MGSLGSLMEKPQHSEKKSLCLLYTVEQRDELLHTEKEGGIITYRKTRRY